MGTQLQAHVEAILELRKEQRALEELDPLVKDPLRELCLEALKEDWRTYHLTDRRDRLHYQQFHWEDLPAEDQQRLPPLDAAPTTTHNSVVELSREWFPSDADSEIGPESEEEVVELDSE